MRQKSHENSSFDTEDCWVVGKWEEHLQDIVLQTSWRQQNLLSFHDQTNLLSWISFEGWKRLKVFLSRGVAGTWYSTGQGSMDWSCGGIGKLSSSIRLIQNPSWAYNVIIVNMLKDYDSILVFVMVIIRIVRSDRRNMSKSCYCTKNLFVVFWVKLSASPMTVASTCLWKAWWGLSQSVSFFTIRDPLELTFNFRLKCSLMIKYAVRRMDNPPLAGTIWPCILFGN